MIFMGYCRTQSPHQSVAILDQIAVYYALNYGFLGLPFHGFTFL